MEIALIAALMLVALGAFWSLDRKDARQQAERDVLLERIQRPERPPVPVREWTPRDPAPADELPLVGAIDLSEPES